MFTDYVQNPLVFSETIWHSADAVFVRSDSGECFSNSRELEGLTLGCIRGYRYGPLDPALESGAIERNAVARHEQLYKLLLSSRVDAIVENIHVLPFHIHESGQDISLFRKCSPHLYEFELAIMVHESKQTFLKDLNAFIRESHENGLLESISLEWLGQAQPMWD